MDDRQQGLLYSSGRTRTRSPSEDSASSGCRTRATSSGRQWPSSTTGSWRSRTCLPATSQPAFATASGAANARRDYSLLFLDILLFSIWNHFGYSCSLFFAGCGVIRNGVKIAHKSSRSEFESIASKDQNYAKKGCVIVQFWKYYNRFNFIIFIFYYGVWLLFNILYI